MMMMLMLMMMMMMMMMMIIITLVLYSAASSESSSALKIYKPTTRIYKLKELNKIVIVQFVNTKMHLDS